MIRLYIIISLAFLFPTLLFSNTHCESEKDSIAISSMLMEAKNMPKDTNWMMFFANHFINTPYVSHTLDQNSTEKLVINTRGVDCTTFVEYVTALAHCISNNETSFRSFCKHLRNIRYAGGMTDYCNRNHYFTQWIEENTANGYIKPVALPSEEIKTISKKLAINFMSSHSHLYAMLQNDSSRMAGIRKMEKRLTGKVVEYIPKKALHNYSALKKHIINGDIIAIMTSRAGLDTSHIGLACWKKGRLHILHASSRYKKVIIEPEPIHQYMAKQPQQTGIMVVRKQPPTH